MDDQTLTYHSPAKAADDFAFIARRMKNMDAPAEYDLGGAGPQPGYRGPIAEDVHEIGERLRALEAAKSQAMRAPAPLPPPPALDPLDDSWFCC